MSANIILGIARDNVVFIFWSGLYFGIKFWMEWISQNEKTDIALLLARNAQLVLLNLLEGEFMKYRKKS